MEASAQKGAQLPPAAFHLRPHPVQQVVFEMPRPPKGYTQVLSSFAGDHPEFQLVREKGRDPDVVRLNDHRHYAADIPPVAKGRKLDCNYCHKPDPEGRFYQRINFEANCQACHALLFDKNNPQLHIPHGDVNLVRTFLRTLPAQYAELARTQNEKAPGYNDVKTFIAQQMNGLRRQFGSDAAFENAVFLETDPYKKEDAAPTKANFSGCAHCHAVKMEGSIGRRGKSCHQRRQSQHRDLAAAPQRHTRPKRRVGATEPRQPMLIGRDQRQRRRKRHLEAWVHDGLRREQQYGERRDRERP